MSAPATTPVYLRSGEHQLFALYDGAAGPTERSAVLICSPWGWEETASYRCRRTWAKELAAAGHPTLRFDLPAVGDSSGAPAEPGLVAAWIAAIAAAAAWLRAESGRDRVCAIGLGIGGTLGLAALEDGAPIDEMVLWALPARGSRFVREIKSFAMLQAGDIGRGEETPLPDDWIEAGGFVLAGETVAALEALDPPQMVPSRLRRVLLLDRDGIAPPASIGERLESHGAEVSLGSGAGWGEMVFHPEHAIYPTETIAAVNGWIDDAEQAAAPWPSLAVETAECFTFEVDGRGARESAFTIPRPDGNSFAILTEPVDGPADDDLCVVFLNSGAIRHIGPNRNWVEACRRWGTLGLRCVRVDLDAIGEADGEPSQDLGVAGFYADEYEEAIRAALDEIERRGLGKRFVCIGLCSGAYWSLQMADRDERVESAILLNAGALVWHTGLRAQREMRWILGSLLQPSSRMKLLRFEVNLLEKVRILQRAAIWRLKQGLRWLRGRLGGSGPHRYSSEVEELFDRVRDSEKRIAMSFCSNEPALAELEDDGILDHLDRWPNIELGILTGEDHSLGPLPGQASGAALVDSELGLILERSGVAPPIERVSEALPR